MSSIIEKAMRGLKAEPARRQTRAKVVSVSPREGRLAAVSPALPSACEFHLDFAGLRRAGYLTPDAVESALAEELRVLKRPIVLNAFGKTPAPVEHSNLVVVTSALPNEGKTFTSINLAMSIAQERDSTALLIDGDLIERSITRFFGLTEVEGLTDLLLDYEKDLSLVMGRTNVPKLRIIPAGRGHPEATELLASDKMERIANELSARYPDRIVIFDAPPLLATSQAVVLTKLVGQILVVVEEGKTTQPMLQEALDLLDPDKVIGMALNKCRRKRGLRHYGGYYGRGQPADD
jgi:exopolysaccharide/PEP-CTERM locus tyrosine autokinase